MSQFKERVTWRDAKGNTATNIFYVTAASLTAANTAATAVITAMTALTNAHLQSQIGPSTSTPTEVIYGTSSSYATVEDKATFTFQTATGSIHRFRIPAPKSTIFLADGETVDAANTDVTAFTSAVIANCASSSNEALAFGGFGVRQRVKIRRKLTIFTKNPTLTGPDE
jgi:hypothetical protein